MTTSSANTMLVTAHTYASSNTWMPQSGLTEGFDRPSGAASATGQSIAGGYQLLAAAGASGIKRSTAAANADVGNTHILALRRFIPNVPPTVSLTSPANGATFTAPASVTLTASAADSDGTISKVEFFHGGTNLIATVTSPPYTFDWINVAAGSYTLTAKATDNLSAATTSAPVSITVTAPAALHFIHPDHLNTPRVITNAAQQVVWRWDNDDAFGGNVANNNPGGLGAFEFNLRFPGQYFDKETNNHYNYFRDYSPEIGRYIESDPIGLTGGINTYVYAYDPLMQIDPLGLMGRGAGKPGPRFPNGNYGSGFSAQNPGCDSFPDILESRCVKWCCEEHDRCYAQHGCNVSSWPGNFQGYSRLYQQCNATAVRCILKARFICTNCPAPPPPPPPPDNARSPFPNG